MLAILVAGATILWYTPYAMAGFVKQTDTLWHMGTAMNMPGIIAGGNIPYSSYISSFPLSFSFGFIFLQVTGMDIIVLSNYVLPLIYIFIFILALFVLFRAFTNQNIAFISSFICVGLLYHISLHHSPQVIGTLLLLVSMFLWLKKSYYISGFIGIALLPVTHIISFAFFIVFILLHILIKTLNPQIERVASIKTFTHKKNMSIIIVAISTTIFLAFLLRIYIALFLDRLSIGNIPHFIWINLIDVPWFKHISSIQYFLIFTIVSIVVVRLFTKSGKSKMNFRTLVLMMKKKCAFIILFAYLCLIIGLVIALAGNSAVLIERGVSFFVLFSALFLMSHFIGLSGETHIFKKSNLGKAIIIVITLSFITYPLGSYAIDSYNSFSQSEKSGIVFLANGMNISDTSIEMSSPGQINAFIETGRNIQFTTYSRANLVIWRLHAENKDVLHDSDSIELKFRHMDSNPEFMKIYSNPAFRIYMRDTVV